MQRLYPPRAWLVALLALCLSALLAWAVHALSRLPDQAQREPVMRLQQGLQWQEPALAAVAAAPTQLPPSMAGAAPLRLPLRVPAGRGQVTWVVLDFSLERPADQAWTLVLDYQPNLQVFLDGRLLAQSARVEAADHRLADYQLGAERLRVNVPPSWLAAGAHRLQLRLGPPGPAGGQLSSAVLGPQGAVERLLGTRPAWATLRAATALAAVVVGLLLVLTWRASRGDRVYLLAGGHVLLLALLLSPYVLDAQPLPSPWWRVLLDVADVLAKALLLATVVALSRRPQPGLLRAIAGYAVVGALIDGAAAWYGLAWNDFSHPWAWWALGSRAAVLLAATALAWRELLRRPDVSHFVTSALVALSAWLWAYVSLFALVLPGRLAVVDVNVVAYAGWVLWVGMLLLRHFIQASRHERVLRQEAADALAERSRELQASFAALQDAERHRTVAAERERLLQEMHDGLGSQLMAAKLGAQAGSLSAADLADALDGCIQELRLSVDALSVEDGDLGLLLGNARHRLQGGLQAAGVTLDWRVTDTPPVPVLAGPGGRELVRIVQEAFSNVLHHAGATRLTVSSAVAINGLGVTVSISDDGCGMAPGAAPGRGTANIRQRAQRLGGRVAWVSPVADGEASEGSEDNAAASSDRPGTRLELWLPLQPAVPAI